MSNGKKYIADFSSLVTGIRDIHRHLQNAASKSVNLMLTLRNWLIGYYIAEYESKVLTVLSTVIG